MGLIRTFKEGSLATSSPAKLLVQPTNADLHTNSTLQGRRTAATVRLAVLTADYLTSDNEPNPSARRGKQACLTLVCSYHVIGNVVFESCGERISMEIRAIGSYRQLD